MLIPFTFWQSASPVLALPGPLVAYYAHNEASGAMLDSSGNNRNGTYGSVTLGAEGVNGTGASFNGTASYATMPASVGTAWGSGGEWTVAQWVRVPSFAVWQDVTVRRSLLIQVDANNRVILYKDSANTNTIGWQYSAGGTTKTVTQTQVPTLWGGYIHVALTVSQSNGRMRAYLNGVQVGADQTSLGTWAGTPGTLTIGATNAVPSQPWSGLIDETAIWTRELTAVEIASLATVTRSLVVFEGDSRTVGTGATTATNYPSRAAAGLAGNWKAANVGASGESVATMQTQIAAQVAPLYSSSYSKNVAVLWGGVNDNTTAATMHSRISSWCSTVRALGFKVVVCTEIDCQAATHTSWHNTEYQALNTLIRANYTTYADGLADLGADARLQDATNAAYFNTTDKTHLIAAGYGVVDGIVRPVVAAL